MSARPLTPPVIALPLWILAVVATLFLLRAASRLLIPIALAALVSYALMPVVNWLEERRVPRLLGAGLLLLLILGACALGVYTQRDDARQLLDMLPKALHRAREMVTTQLGGVETRVLDAAGSTGGSLVERTVTAVVSFAADLVVIFFLVYFLLVFSGHLRNRVIEIAGSDVEQRRLATSIIDDINGQIQRYLLVLLVTAVIVGVATWVVLAWMGVRNAAMWGTLAGVFNSIPYFGPVIVSGGLFLVGVMQGGGVTQALQMAGAAIAITSLEGWLLAPALMGKAERMSALAVFLGLLLWTWLLGGWGTVLAVPMLVVIKSVADRVDGLRPLGRLMAP